MCTLDGNTDIVSRDAVTPAAAIITIEIARYHDSSSESAMTSHATITAVIDLSITPVMTILDESAIFISHGPHT